MVHYFPPFELDDDLFELRCDGRPVQVEPKVFNFIAYLVTHRNRVVEKQELYDSLWPDEVVSESALAYCVKSARRALRTANGADAPVIKTIHGRGFRFLGQTVETATATQSPSEQKSSLLLGRSEEVQIIDQAIAEAANHDAVVVAISGEPGIGKSRLVQEACDRARGMGSDIVTGQCYEGDDPPAFQPWTHVIRDFSESHDPQLTRSTLGAGAADIAQLTPSLRTTLNGIDHLPELDPGQARARFFDSVVTFLRAAATQTPLVVVFEDLHWADEPSLQLIETAVRELPNIPILWLFTYRDLEVQRSDRLGQLMTTLERESQVRKIPLRGLASDATYELVRAPLAQLNDDRAADAVVQLSEGNPLFALELARYVRDEGSSRIIAGWGPRGSTVQIPGGIAGVIARRLARLSTSCRKILANASVIGRTFDFDTLKDISDCSEDDLLDALDSASAASVVEEARDGETYSFAHGLIRQSIYHELGAARRARIHRKVADVLERRTASDPHAPLAELAHHFFQSLAGGDAEKTIYYSTQAANDALKRYAHEDAARLYQQALHAMELEGGDDSRAHELHRCDLLLNLGEALSFAGDPSRSSEIYDQAAELARRLDTPDRLARAALRGSGSLLQRLIVDESSLNALEEALTVLRPGDSDLRARVMSRLALTLYYHPAGTRKRRIELSSEAVEIARQINSPETLYWSQISRHWALWGPASSTERLNVIDEIVSIARGLDDPVMTARAQVYKVGAYMEIGDIDRMKDEIAEAQATADMLRVPLFQWSARYFKSATALLRGDFEEAEAQRLSAFAIGARTDLENSYLVTLLQIANRCFVQGRMQDFGAEIEPLIARGLHFQVLPCALAVSRASEGKEDEAHATYTSILERGLDKLPEDNLWLTTMAMLSSVAGHLGERKGSREIYDAMMPYRGTMVVAGNATACFGSVEHYLGVCAALFGDFAAAETHFGQALETHRKIGAPPMETITLWAHANSIARGSQRNRDRAATMFDEALAIGERIQVGEIVKRIAADRAALQSRRTRTSSKSKDTANVRPGKKKRSNAAK